MRILLLILKYTSHIGNMLVFLERIRVYFKWEVCEQLRHENVFVTQESVGSLGRKTIPFILHDCSCIRIPIFLRATVHQASIEKGGSVASSV